MPIVFPSGDKEKELWPQSDYRSKFLGEQPHSHELAKAKAGSFGGPPTITGDPRTQLGQFVTTTKSEFVGRYLPKQQIDPNLKVYAVQHNTFGMTLLSLGSSHRSYILFNFSKQYHFLCKLLVLKTRKIRS